jgi:hypothetical protein
MSPNAGGGGVEGSQPMSAPVHSRPNKLWRSNSIPYGTYLTNVVGYLLLTAWIALGKQGGLQGATESKQVFWSILSWPPGSDFVPTFSTSGRSGESLSPRTYTIHLWVASPSLENYKAIVQSPYF